MDRSIRAARTQGCEAAGRSRIEAQDQSASRNTGIGPISESTTIRKTRGNLTGRCSRRINIQHRLIYEVFKKLRTVRVLHIVHPVSELPNVPRERRGYLRLSLAIYGSRMRSMQ